MKPQTILALLLIPGLLSAAVDEDAMFGGDASSPGPASVHGSVGAGASASGAGEAGRGDEAGLAQTKHADAFASGETKADPLAIGGTLYQTLDVPLTRGIAEGEQGLSLPLQVDVYLDGRPNDRVRTYVVGRLLYDSSKDAYGKATAGSTGFTVPGAVTKTALPVNPQVVLDQAWIKFDVDRVAFISLGKQHVKWGTGRIWNPSDALNPQRRDPLQPYDLRLGSNLASVQVPWEAEQANFYAVALFDDPQPASTLQQLGGALRIEGLLGPAEVGFDAVGRAGETPRFGADLSSPLGPFDSYVEAAFLSNDGHLSNTQWLGLPANAGPSTSINSLYASNGLPGSALQIVGGLNYTFAWRDNRSATLGGEYFYNELGVTDASLYPVLLYQGRYTPFYLGKHYAAIYLSAEGPDAGNKTNYNLSTLTNVSDGSYVSRLDFTWLLLDYLTFGAYASVNYGNKGGEFNFALDTPALTGNGGSPISPIKYEGNSGAAGMSLRVAF